MSLARILALALLTAWLAPACSEAEPEVAPPPVRAASAQPVHQGPLVLFLGDSLSAGLHLHEEQAFPAVLQRMSVEAGHPFRLINAGLSGDTTAGGLDRLGWSLKQKPQLVVLELGANDGRRGIELGNIESNLRRMIEEIRASGARVLLLGMKMPTNYGPEYTAGFEGLYQRLASEMQVSLVPFFLQGVALVPELNLPDGIHPTAEGHERIADTVAPQLWSLLADL